MSLQPPALIDRAFIADLLAALSHPQGVQLSIVEVRHATQQPGGANDEHSREEMLLRRGEEGEGPQQRDWDEADHAAEAAATTGTGIIRASGREGGGIGVDTWYQWRPVVVIVFDLWVLVDGRSGLRDATAAREIAISLGSMIAGRTTHTGSNWCPLRDGTVTRFLHTAAGLQEVVQSGTSTHSIRLPSHAPLTSREAHRSFADGEGGGSAAQAVISVSLLLVLGAFVAVSLWACGRARVPPHPGRRSSVLNSILSLMRRGNRREQWLLPWRLPERAQRSRPSWSRLDMHLDMHEEEADEDTPVLARAHAQRE